MQVTTATDTDVILNFARSELERYFGLLSAVLLDLAEQELLHSLSIVFLDPTKDELPTSIYQSVNYLQTSQKDSYFIEATEKGLILGGKSSRAILFACYDLLQQLGIRWYFPGKKFEEFPEHIRNNPLNLHIIEIPAIAQRGILIDGKPRNILDWIDFAAKQRINWLALPTFQFYTRTQIQSEITKRGLDLDIQEHSLNNRLCSRDPQNYKVSEDLVIKYIEHINYDTHFIYCLSSERFIPRCHCHADRYKRTSDVLLERLNFMANNPKLRKDHRLVFNANLGTWNLPTIIRPHPHVALQLAPIHRCFSHSIADPFCRINKRIVKPEFDQFLDFFSPASSQVLDYWLDASLFGSREFQSFGWAYQPGNGRIPHIPRVMKKDLEFYASKNIQRIMTRAVGIDEDYLKTFISPMISFYPQLVWNPSLEIHTLLRNFCSDFFGSDQVQMFFDESEIIDPKDISATQFSGIMDLTHQRLKLLKEYFKQIISVRLKNRVQLLIQDQNLKLSWRTLFGSARIKGIFNLIWFLIQRRRC